MNSEQDVMKMIKSIKINENLVNEEEEIEEEEEDEPIISNYYNYIFLNFFYIYLMYCRCN